MGLRNGYHNKDIQDGTRKALRIKRREREKSVYFNNFPRRIKAFAE